MGCEKGEELILNVNRDRRDVCPNPGFTHNCHSNATFKPLHLGLSEKINHVKSLTSFLEKL